ncbi:MAG: GumC family protein [Hyphomonadaceae bacterium]
MNLITVRQQVDELEPYAPEPQAGGVEGASIVRWALAFLVRRWLLIGAVGGVVAVIAFLGLALQSPRYSATAIVLINPGQERVLSQDQMITGMDDMPSASVVDSHIQVLTSPMLMGRLAESLGLVSDPDWNGGLDLPAAAPPEDSPQAAVYASARLQIANYLASVVSVRRRAASFAVEVTAETEDPDLSANIANRLVELYLNYQLEARFQAAERANAWLSERLEVQREDVQRKEAAAETFRAESGLLSTQGVTFTEQQTTEIQGSVLQARADLAEREAQYRQLQQVIQSGGSGDTIAGVLNSEVIASLRSREADIARRQADAESRYGDLHPVVQNVRAERQDIRNQITAETQRIAASLRNEVEIARARLNTLEGNLGQVRGQLAGNSGDMVRLRELEREAAAARTVYEAFLERYHQIQDQGSLRSTSAQLISSASVPIDRSSPQLRIALMLALAIGLAIGLAAGVVAEALDEGFRSAEEIEQKLGMPVISSVPRLRRKDMRSLPQSEQHPAGYLMERQMSAFTESFRVARTSIMYGNSHRNNQILAITSALPNEGKTTVSLCLARAAALSQQRVLLIDCDLRKRSLKDVLGFEPDTGLVQVLQGETNWRQAVVLDEATGMQVLPLRESRFTSEDVFGSDAMSTLLTDLRHHFDLIILDCAPVLAVAETRVIASLADSTVVVARWEKTPVKAVRTTLQYLVNTRDNVLGVILNNVDTRLPGYSYHMGSYYEA